MKKLLNYLGLILLAATVLSCNADTKSLQRYYVDHQDSENFITIDLPASLIFNNLESLPAETRDNLNAIRKANMLALPLNGQNKEQYNTEKQEVLKILNSDKYSMLAKLKFSDMSVQLHSLEKKNEIEELVFMGYSDKNGFLVARLLGKISPETVASFITALKNEDVEVNLDSMEDILNSLN